MPAPIRDASTVLPLRDSPAGLEVFMVRRSARLGFLGGAHVFPGGAVDPEDRAEAVRRYLQGFEAAAACRTLRTDDELRVRGHYVAAFRELFEEAGVLLAVSSTGELCGAGEQARLSVDRILLARGRRAFVDVLEGLGLRLSADRLLYFAHWITPASSPKRFDTRFFVAIMPPGQSAQHDRAESADGEWVSPRDGLARYARGEVEMVVPTICALDRLTLHDTAADALRACRELDVVDVVPKVATANDRVAIFYPGDAEYGPAGGISEPGRLLSRQVLKGGRWQKP